MTLQLTINGTRWTEFRDTLEALTPFKTYGNLSGDAHDHGYVYAGRLPEPYRAEFFERRQHIDYVVTSYSTPIAWHDAERGWVMPKVKYSTTTSKAQGRIAPAVAALNGES